jgi:hypothetical protein
VSAPSRTRAALLAIAALALAATLSPAAARADFGIAAFSAVAENEEGLSETQAGSHPYRYRLSFTMNQDGEGRPEGTLANLVVDLPPGLVGNPTAVPQCKRIDFDWGLLPLCPGDSQIGVADLELNRGEIHVEDVPVYNLVPAPGSPASIGLSIDQNISSQEASLRSDSDYGVSVSDLTIPTIVEVQSITETIWGQPSDPSHDPQRVCVTGGEVDPRRIEGCGSNVSPPVPFLTLPVSCAGPAPRLGLRADSVQGDSAAAEFTAPALDGCNALEFAPSIEAKPSTNRADSPSGLDFNLHQPYSEDPEGLATGILRDTTVTLPAGMSVNPAAANGLQACTEAQIGRLPSAGVHFSAAPQSCPEASKLGTLQVDSPLVDHPLKGAVYLAEPYANPFGSLIAIYLAVEDPITGTYAKLSGRVGADPQSGQLTTTFEQSPQLPIEDIDLHLFEGARAPLRTPLACGTHTTTSTLVPWSSPEGQDAHPSDSFQISQPAGSGPCPGSEAQAPNSPSFAAGTESPQAGAYSPFVLHLSRPDGSQQLSGIDTTLPEGLLGRLTGTAICPEAAIAVARARERPNQGAVEQGDPSCPASSQVGTATVGAGAGPSPFYATGRAYLAGPYKGAPLSLVIVTPAVAGPFDLGAVVVRAALYVNPETTRIRAVSDPIPQILQGVPLDLRSIAVQIDRPNFTLNPTSCEPLSILGAAATAAGQSAALSSPFQVGGCSALGFKPTLNLRLKGGTKRASNPKLIATLKPRAGDANISSLAVKLPPSAFLDQSHIRTVCTRVQFAAEQCPPGSIYGRVEVSTPILPYELSGNVYLRSSSNKLPDLIADLRGPAYQPIRFDLSGRTDSVKGALRNSFDFVPDAPFTQARLELFGGKRGLVVNSRDLCKHAYRAKVVFSAHNGRRYEAKPKVRNSCGKAKHKRKHAKHKRTQSHKRGGSR